MKTENLGIVYDNFSVHLISRIEIENEMRKQRNFTHDEARVDYSLMDESILQQRLKILGTSPFLYSGEDFSFKYFCKKKRRENNTLGKISQFKIPYDVLQKKLVYSRSNLDQYIYIHV